MTKTETISAIHDDDFRDYLKTLGVLRGVEKGELTCSFCSQQLTLENIAALYPRRGTVRAVCDRPECVKRLMRTRMEEC